MPKVLTLTRAVTQHECPWLDRDLQKGENVWAYEGVTYGCVSDNGLAVTAKLAESPFFEIPHDAVGGHI